MNASIYSLALLVCFIGGVGYFALERGKSLPELCRIAFAMGLLAWLMTQANHCTLSLH